MKVLILNFIIIKINFFLFSNIKYMSQYRKYLTKFTLEESKLVVSLDDFEFGDVIGKGGFGEVRRAIRKSTCQDCAVKHIFSEKLEGNKLKRYIGEIETMARTDNMFLVPFVGFTSEPPYTIVTEYMVNGALDGYVREKSSEISLSGTQLTAIAIGIAYGMVHLHSLNIIHRDLKCANILLDSRLFPRIGDFGIARFMADDEYTVKIGTPNYMAPELITSSDYDTKVDVYAYAMILYEMAENQRPFRGMKINEIFSHVVKHKLRPKFSSFTPKPLQKLIESCWDQNPCKRPTFIDIFETLKRGDVEFPNTRRNEIEKFLSVIKNDEERRDEIAFYKTKTHDPEYCAYNKCANSDYTYYSDNDIAEGHKKPSTPKQSKSHTPTSEKKKKSEGVHEKPETILSDHTHPLFSKYLEYYSQNVNINQIHAFYKPIAKHLHSKSPTNVSSAVISAVINLMKRNSSFIPLLDDVNFFTSLPCHNEALLDLVVECYRVLFIDHSQILGSQHCEVIANLLKKRSEKMIILHSFYIKQMLSLQNPWPILDNLLNVQYVLLTKSCGYMYLGLFYYLITHYDIYANVRQMHIRSVFIAFLNSQDPLTITSAYNGLCRIYHNDLKGINFTKVADHLMDDALWYSALSLLIRNPNILPSKELISALIYRGKSSPKTWIVILNIANSKSGSEFFIQHLDLLFNQTENHTINVFRVFMQLFTNKKYRSELAKNDDFLILFKMAVETEDEDVHSAITAVIRRLDIDSILMTRLTQSGFLKSYINVTIKASKMKMLSNCLAMLDALSRIDYSNDYLLFVQPLVDLLSSETHCSDAITVIVSFSFHKQCTREFVKLGLVDYFKGLIQDEQYQLLASAFLKNVQRCY